LAARERGATPGRAPDAGTDYRVAVGRLRLPRPRILQDGRAASKTVFLPIRRVVTPPAGRTRPYSGARDRQRDVECWPGTTCPLVAERQAEADIEKEVVLSRTRPFADLRDYRRKVGSWPGAHWTLGNANSSKHTAIVWIV